MGDLLTLAQYESYIPGTLSTADRTLINLLIPVASRAVERYTDRLLGLATYIEWITDPGAPGVFFPFEYPSGSLYAALQSDTAITVTNSGTTNYALVITTDRATVYNAITNATTSFVFATYTSLSTLTAAITAIYTDLTFSIAISTATASTLLAPGSLSVLAGGTADMRAACTPISAKMDADGRILYTSGASQGTWTTVDGNGSPRDGQSTNTGMICLVYSAGYDPIPVDLQVIVANIIRDMLGVQKGRITTGVKSEGVAQYNYVLKDGIDMDSIVRTKYQSALSPFKRIVF